MRRSVATYEPIGTRYEAFTTFSVGVSPTATAVGSRERRHEPYDRQRVLRHMSATQERDQDSANVHHANDIIRPARLVLDHQGADGPPPVTMVEPSEGESKRPRLEETQNQDNDNTSNYDLSDYEDIECDEAPFTSVTYKKKRSEGIPVVFRPSEEGHTFWQVNPNRVSSEIVSAAKEKVQSF